MDDSEERMQILEMIDSGKISATEGLRLLQALSGKEPAALEETLPPEDGVSQAAPTVLEPPLADATAQAAQSEAAEPEVIQAPQTAQPRSLPPDARKWRRWWMIPFWIGVGITISGAMLMYWAQQTSGLGYWFVCAGVPFTIGLLILILAWGSRTSPWLHLRVEQAPGERPQRIALSFPIPVRPAVWFFRMFGHRIPNLEQTSVDEIILAVGKNATPDNPIYIQVDEGQDGERVEIFIG
jgi:hypothetical protein